MTAEENSNLEAVQQLYRTIANGPVDEAFESLYHPDIVQEEFPNRLLPNGARRTLAELRDAAAKGRALMASQTFELVNAVATGAHVAIEGRWSGTVGKDIGPFTTGMTIRTRFAQFIEFRDGRIIAIRNYDCFDPW